MTPDTGRVRNQVPSSNAGVRAAQLNRQVAIRMPTIVSTFSVVAALSVVSVLFLFLGSRLPEPFRDRDGGDALGFALLVYFVALVCLATGVLGWSQVLDAVRSRYKYLFSVSALIVIAFAGFASFALYTLLQAEGM